MQTLPSAFDAASGQQGALQHRSNRRTAFLNNVVINRRSQRKNTAHMALTFTEPHWAQPDFHSQGIIQSLSQHVSLQPLPSAPPDVGGGLFPILLLLSCQT